MEYTILYHVLKLKKKCLNILVENFVHLYNHFLARGNLGVFEIKVKTQKLGPFSSPITLQAPFSLTRLSGKCEK